MRNHQPIALLPLLLIGILLITGCGGTGRAPKPPPEPDLMPLAVAFIILGVCGVISSLIWGRAIQHFANRNRNKGRRNYARHTRHR